MIKYLETYSGRQHYSCEKCAEDINCNVIAIRKHLAIGDFPILPLSRNIIFLECPKCLNRYPEALIRAVEVKNVLFVIAVRRIMAYMAIADGKIDGSEIKVIETFEKDALNHSPEENEIRIYIEEQKNKKIDSLNYLMEISSLLSEKEKELILEGAFLVLAADGKIDDAEERFLIDAAISMGFSPTHYNGFIDGLRNR